MTRRKAYEREARIVRLNGADRWPQARDCVRDDSGCWWLVEKVGWVAEERMPGTEGGNYCAAYLVADSNPSGIVASASSPYPGRVVFPPEGWEAVPRWGNV